MTEKIGNPAQFVAHDVALSFFYTQGNPRMQYDGILPAIAAEYEPGSDCLRILLHGNELLEELEKIPLPTYHAPIIKLKNPIEGEPPVQQSLPDSRMVSFRHTVEGGRFQLIHTPPENYIHTSLSGMVLWDEHFVLRGRAGRRNRPTEHMSLLRECVLLGNRISGSPTFDKIFVRMRQELLEHPAAYASNLWQLAQTWEAQPTNEGVFFGTPMPFAREPYLPDTIGAIIQRLAENAPNKNTS